MRNIRSKWNNFVKNHLRKVGIFRRLIISFLLLLLISALFLTFFSYYQYSKEINLNLYRYVSLLVQNVELKIRDILKEYEDDAVLFYGASRIIGAWQKTPLFFMKIQRKLGKNLKKTGLLWRQCSTGCVKTIRTLRISSLSLLIASII